MLHKLGIPPQIQPSLAATKLWVRRIGLFVAVGVGYFLAAQLGLTLLTTPERMAVFWPASGIAVGVLLALGARARGPVAAAVIAATLAANIFADRSIWSALAFAICNAGEALMVLWLIERWFGPSFDLDVVRRVLGFLAAATVATAIAAVPAAGAIKLFGPSTGFFDDWVIWFASDALGVVTVAPVLIGIVVSFRDVPSRRELIEGTLAVVAVAVANGFALALLTGPRSLMAPAVFLFPLLLWLASRCRPVFSAAAAFTVTAAIVWTTIHGFGRYGDPSMAIADRVLAAQVSMLGTILAALALAAVFAERRRHGAALDERDASLRSILDAANVIAWDVDLVRNVVQSVGPVARLLHRPVGSVPGDFAAMAETIHPEDRDAVMAQFWAAVSTSATYRLEFRLNSESPSWVTAEGSIDRDAHGQPVRVRGITHDITERKKAELTLIERDAQLSLAEKAARVGNFAIDIRTGKVRNSPGYATIHGLVEGTDEFSREEWRGRVHPDDLQRLDALRSQAFAERRGEHKTEYRIVGPDGKARWIESRSLISYDGDGQPIRLVGLNIDMTERKLAQAALEESEVRYRALYDDNPSMFFTVDETGTVLSVNEFGAQQLGYTPAEIVGQSVLNVIHEEDREAVRRHLASCTENPRTVVTTELRKARRDGSIMWVREAARAVREPAQQRTVLLLVCEEITERKKAELALAERNIQLALAGKAALVGSYAYDIDDEIMQISEGYVAIHGFPEGVSEIKRSECLAGVHPDDMGRVELFRSEAFRAGRREYSVEYRIIRRGGDVRWVETRCFISFNGEGRPQRVIGVSIDITERKRVEEQQRRLVAELDHRVKNVLATVQAVTTHTIEASSSLEQFASALDGRIRSMGSTHELLSHRRWRDVPLTELVERELAPYTTGSNTDIRGSEVMLSADAAQTMGMVFHELVTNAAKYGALSNPSGRVSIRWRLALNGNVKDRLEVIWRETGRPLPVPASGSSYGMHLIRELIPYELGGTVEHVLAPEGARCRIEIPLAQLCGGSSQYNQDPFLPDDDIEKIAGY